jgi:hypothetical protein
MSRKPMQSSDSGIRAFGLHRLAEDLGVSVGFLRLEITRGRLRPTRLGRRVLLTSHEINRYLAMNTAAGPEATR